MTRDREDHLTDHVKHMIIEMRVNNFGLCNDGHHTKLTVELCNDRHIEVQWRGTVTTTCVCQLQSDLRQHKALDSRWCGRSTNPLLQYILELEELNGWLENQMGKRDTCPECGKPRVKLEAR